jgi:hypothetical protein
MNSYIKPSELNISGDPIPNEVADKMVEYHIIPMNAVRAALGLPVLASEKSGWRPLWWEKNNGRDGSSEHIYNGMGAVDWTCQDFQKNKDKFLKLIIELTEYTRISIYATFIHCDYKPTKSGRREFYTSNSSSQWKFVKFID